jgi:hypothetical protein
MLLCVCLFFFGNISWSYAMLAYAVHACRMRLCSQIFFQGLAQLPASVTAPTLPGLAFRTRRQGHSRCSTSRWKEEYLLKARKIMDEDL